MSLRLRAFLAFVVLAAAFVLVLTRLTLRDIRPQPLQASEDALVETANVLAALLEARATDSGIAVDELREVMEAALRRPLNARIYEHAKTSLALRVYVTDARGVVLYDTAGLAVQQDYSGWLDVSRTLRGEYGARATRSDPEEALSSVHFVAAPVRRGGRLLGVVSVGKPVASLEAFIARTNRRIVAAAATTVLVAALVGLALASWVTVPLRRLERYAAATAEGARPGLPRLGAPELLSLGRALESMREALEGKRYVEGYVRSLTHEIKGPLAAIRASAELLDEDMARGDRARFLANIRSEAERLRHLVDRMLELSALEARRDLGSREPLDARAVASEAAAGAEPLAVRKGLALVVEPGPPVPITGDPLLLRQAVANLLQNAVHATPEGGRVAVAVVVEPDRVRFVVTDSGPGVPDWALPRVFERFYTAPVGSSPASGTGLGLPFVREVALLHGGEARVENAPGGGARAELSLAR